MTIFIIWPERRHVPDGQIASWFADAVADNLIHPAFQSVETILEMAEALDDAGFITLGRQEKGRE